MKRSLLACAAVLSGCTAIDSDTARPYPCEIDTDCRGGWVCGLEKVCHAPEPGAWKCDPDAGGAEAACFGWHCGLEGVCYPLDAGVAHSCRYSDEQAGARSDCDEGWRCGLEGSCHRVGEAQAWRCLSDRDCEGTWRCAATGVCVNPSSERPQHLGLFAPMAKRLAPQLFDSLPELIAGGAAYGGGFGGGLSGSLSWAHGAQVTHLVYASGGVGALTGPWSDAVTDAGHGNDTSLRMQAPLPFSPTALAEVQDGFGTQTYLLGDGGLHRIRWSVDGGTLAQLGASPPLDGLVPAASGVAAWRGSQVYWLAPDGTLLNVADLGEPVRAAQYGWTTSFGMPGPLFVTTSTLWLLEAAADGGMQATAHALQQNSAPFVFDGGIAWAQGSLALVSDGVVTQFSGGSGMPYTAGQTCPVCPPGYEPVAPTYCQSDAGVVQVGYGGSPCEVHVGTEKGAPRVWSVRGQMAWADAWGHYALNSDTPLEVPGAGRLHYAVYALGDALAAGGAGGAVSSGSPALSLAREGQGWQGLAGQVAFRPLEVRNAPSWAALFDDTVVDLAQGPGAAPWTGPVVANVAMMFNNADSLQPACFTRTPDGGGLFASMNSDVLETSQVGPTPGPSVGRLAPFPSLPLDSVALFPGDADAGTLVRGYVLSSAGVAYVEAFTERAWSGFTVDIPPGDWLELLADDTRARVAYSNGRVVTLPSRLDISELLPVPAYDFATYSGADFALTSQGLYVSSPNPDGGALFTWTSVPLPPGTTQPGYPPNDFSSGHLLGGTNRLYVVTPQDTAFSVVFQDTR